MLDIEREYEVAKAKCDDAFERNWECQRETSRQIEAQIFELSLSDKEVSEKSGSTGLKIEGTKSQLDARHAQSVAIVEQHRELKMVECRSLAS